MIKILFFLRRLFSLIIQVKLELIVGILFSLRL
jgi:hypothetical protein